MKKEFAAAMAALASRTPDEESVHDARKSVKKIRSVLRLLWNDLGSAGVRQERRLRAAAHALSWLRDADATAETLEILHGRYPAVVNGSVIRAVLRGLAARRRRTRRGAGLLAHKARAGVSRARDDVPSEVRRAAGRGAVLSGLCCGYRRARRRLRGVSLESDATQFHALRRRVKEHAHHVRLFEGLHATPRARARSLDRLDEWLGEDHNQALLRATILAHPERFGAASATSAVLGSIVKRQGYLRGRALRLGHRLFAVKPRRFRQAALAWWPRRSG
jgi:CHAD domain-containing protein